MQITNDLRYSWRSIRKSPGLLVVAALSLGLGIALNTTLFSLVYSALFRMPEVVRPNELINIYTTSTQETGSNELGPQSVPDYLDLSRSAESFSDLIAHSWAIMNLEVDGRPTPMLGAVVSHNYLDVLGVRPQLGRGFVEEEGVGESAAPTAILTDSYWQREFGGNPNALSQTLRIRGVDFEIVGVLPPRFRGLTRGLQPEVLVPLAQVDHVEPMGEISTQGSSGGLGTLDWRGMRFLTLVGRLNQDVSLATASAEMETLASSMAAEYPDSNRDLSAALLRTSNVRFDPDFDAIVVPAALLMLGLVAMVLLIACANIGNMLLAKAEGRRREIAVRLSLGSSRFQLLRLLLIESLMLALIGGVAGLGIAAVASKLISRVRFDLPIELALEARLDPPVLLFTLVISIVTGLFFGLIPALQASAPSLVPALKAAPRAVGARGIRRWFQPARLLVVSQVALSLVLLIGAGLLQRSVQQAKAVDLGFEPSTIGAMTTDLSSLDLSGDALEAKWNELEAFLQSQPNVEHASSAARVPLDLNLHTMGVVIPGHNESPDDPPITVDNTSTTNAYFETLGIQLAEGSWFPTSSSAQTDDAAEGIDTATEAAESQEIAPVLINKAMAERYWPGQSAVGQSFRGREADSTRYTILGIVENYKVRTPGEQPRPMVHRYRPHRPSVFGTFLYRTSVPVNQVQEAVTRTLLETHPDLFVLESTTLERRRNLVLLPIRVGGVLVSGLSVLALLLAVVGLAGLVAYWVTQRTKEIGVRTALGADRGSIVRLVMARSLSLVLVGSALGVLGSLLLGRLMQSALYVSAFDPISIVLGVVALTAAATLASVIPVRRATRIDAIKALRAE